MASITNHSSGARGIIVGGTIVAMSIGLIFLVPKSPVGRPKKAPIAIRTNPTTIVSRGGQAVSQNAVTVGSETIVSGVRDAQGGVTADKIIVRS